MYLWDNFFLLLNETANYAKPGYHVNALFLPAVDSALSSLKVLALFPLQYEIKWFS